MTYPELEALPKRPVRHVSYSQVDKFATCQLAWYFRHVLGIKKAASLAMVAGTAFHKTMEVYFNNQIAGGKNWYTLGRLGKYFEREFVKQRAANNLTFADPEKVQAMTSGILNVLGRYYSEHMVNMHAVRTEHQCACDLGNGKEFKGVIDLVLDDGTLVDFKVTGGSFDRKKADTSYQSTAYAFLENRAIDLQYHVMKWKQVRNPVDTHCVSRDSSDVESYVGYLRRVCLVMDEIVDGQLKPAIGQSACFFCEYTEECQTYRNKSTSGGEEFGFEFEV